MGHVSGKQDWRCGMNQTLKVKVSKYLLIDTLKGINSFKQQGGGHGS